MSRSLSTTAKQAIFSQETTEVFLMLVTLEHADITTVRVVNNWENITSNSNTFVGYPFEFRIPSEDGESLSTVDLVITNVDKLLVDEVRSISTPIDVTLQIVLASDPDTVEASFSMKMRQVEYDANLLKGTCNFEDLLNEPYPAGIYSPIDYPGLF